MYEILILIGLCIGVPCVIGWLIDSDEIIYFLSTLLSILTLGIVIGCVIASYDSYANTRAFYDGVSEQYRECITMYEDKAVINIKDASLTDFKYQGYQKNIAEMVKDLRDKIAWYNETILKKRIYEKNPLINLFIIAPDKDMRLLKMGG